MILCIVALYIYRETKYPYAEYIGFAQQGFDSSLFYRGGFFETLLEKSSHILQPTPASFKMGTPLVKVESASNSSSTFGLCI